MGSFLRLALLGLSFLAACATEPGPPSPPADDDDDDDDDDSATPAPPPRLVINELVAAPDDWIELWNPGPEPAPLARFALREHEDDDPWPLDSSLTLAPGARVVLLADGEPELGPTHLPFSLDLDGGRLELLRDDDLLDALEYGELLAGWSLARNGDGSHDWEVRPAPSPGDANPVGAAPLPSPPAPSWCGLADTPVVDEALEGSALEVAVTCADGAWSGFETLALTASPGATWDPATGRWTLATGLDSAGTHEVLFVAKPLGHGGVPETERSRVHVVDAWDAVANTPVDPVTYVREWGLPVLHLAPASEVSQEYGPAAAWFDGVAYSAQMKIRGASSAGYPKNHFTVEFDPIQLDLSAQGLGRKDHLVLVSSFDDNAAVRQKLAFDVWAEMATYRSVQRMTPRTCWLVLYLDGAYFGLMMAIDHVDDEFIREMGFDDTDTNLYKSVNHDANFALTLSGGGPKATLTEGWEKKEGVDGDFADLIGLTEFVGGATPAQFAAAANDWLELTDFEDWLIFVHALAAADSAGKNAYLYDDPLAIRFRFVPWDFNHAYGQDWRTLRVAPDWHSDFTTANAIFAHLVAEPDLAGALWTHDALLRAPGGPLSPEWQLARIADYYDDIQRSVWRDEGKWGEAYRAYGGWAGLRGDDWEDADGERAYLEQWIVDRAAALDVLHPVGVR